MKRLLIASIVLLVSACGGGNNNGSPGAAPAAAPTPPPEPEPVNAMFSVTTTNLTVAQPLSPLAAILHDDAQGAFVIGEPASPGLEVLAEGGDNSELLAEFEGAAEVSGEAPLGPGASETLELDVGSDDTSGLRLTLMSMLVNTNDAITGLNGLDVSGMEVGDSVTVSVIAYDSGTEANTEAAGTIPGPADGGEGFNAARDDIGDQVTQHPGVVTADDGLSDSTLNQSHRWDNPVARITVSRTQ